MRPLPEAVQGEKMTTGCSVVLRNAVICAFCFAATGSVMASEAEVLEVKGEGICPVTISTEAAFRYSNEALQTTLWSLGVVLFTPEGPGTIYEDGSLGMKWHWYRYVEGPLHITGRRLDKDSPPLRAHIPEGYGDVGFQATVLVYPTAGCWEVTGTVGGKSLTFVMLVIDVCEYGALCD